MSVDVIVIFQAVPGMADELLALLQTGREISSRAPGCESFELFQREDDPQKFVFLERWTSIDRHHDNMTENIVGSGHFAKLLPLLAGPPDNGVIRRVG